LIYFKRLNLKNEKSYLLLMVIKTPLILPGEPGWNELKEKKRKKKEETSKKRKVVDKIGKVVLGDSGYRFGRAVGNFRGDKKYVIWRYKRRIGEVVVLNEGGADEKIELSFVRLGGVGNYKHLIQDADFQVRWIAREQELLMTQRECYLCKKALSKSATPNLYHYNLFKKRTKILEEAEKVSGDVLNGKLTVSAGWEKFNSIIEDGNRYYMSLDETALICAGCAKRKGIV
jgi:hypothetical protein